MAATTTATTNGNVETTKLHLRVLTNSELREARACLRRHHFRYGLRRRPRVAAEPLTFGTLVHTGHEAWRLCDGDPSDRFTCAVDAIRDRAAKDSDVTPFMVVAAEELMRGYAARWSDDGLKTVAVERSFEMPLINPETGAASRTFRIGGKLDGVVEDHRGVKHVEELKTTGSDIGLGSLYWERVRALDTQVSIYLNGARAIGFDVETCIYTVIRKPSIRPLKATPTEDRKYTQPKDRACKECKKKTPSPLPHIETVGEGDEAREVSCVDGRIVTDPGGKLYANLRESDETPEEYRARLQSDIAEKPDWYYARGTVVRLDADEREHAFDMWQSAKMLHEAERSGFHPRNPDACASFGGCAYLSVCTGQASIDDDMLFRTADAAHEELQTEV